MNRSQTLQAAGVLYLLQTTLAVSAGTATAGVAFFDAGGRIIAAPAMDLLGANATARTMRVSAPQGCMAVSVFVGKFDGAGGHVEVRPGSWLLDRTLPLSLQPVHRNAALTHWCSFRRTLSLRYLGAMHPDPTCCLLTVLALAYSSAPLSRL